MSKDTVLEALKKQCLAEHRSKMDALKARREKMSQKPLQCPKCRQKDINVIETTEALSTHRIVNGVWNHFWDNNEYGDIVNVECRCNNCGHQWHSQRGNNLYLYFLDETYEPS